MKIQPPNLAQRFLLFFLKEDLAEEVLGDLEEKFYAVLEEKPLYRARFNYWYQVFYYLLPFAIRNLKSDSSMHSTMVNHYFKISWWIFAVAALAALPITLLTISYQTIKAALINPVNSLRSE